MTLKASAAVVSSIAISTMGLIISRTGVSLAGRPLSANLARTSRSVNMPATTPCSSITATAPTSLSIITRIASSTVASTETVAGPSSHHCRRLMTGLVSFLWDCEVMFSPGRESRGMPHARAEVYHREKRRMIASVRWQHGDVEVHQFGAAGVAHAGEINVRALHGIADAFDVEEEEAGLGGMGFDGQGAKAGAIDLLELLLGLFILNSAGDRNWADTSRIGAADADVRDPAHDVVSAERVELGVRRGDQLGLHLGHRDGLVAVVGDDEKNRQNSLLHVARAEDVVLG